MFEYIVSINVCISSLRTDESTGSWRRDAVAAAVSHESTLERSVQKNYLATQTFCNRFGLCCLDYLHLSGQKAEAIKSLSANRESLYRSRKQNKTCWAMHTRR